MNKTDQQLKQDIDAELAWDPQVNAAQIGVSVDSGAVTLLGIVDTYAQKQAAEEATKRVAGVRTVAQDLVVRVLDHHRRNDSEIAQAIQRALSWSVSVPDTVTAMVRDGIVTLAGQVTWNFEREAAERAIRTLTGVVAIHNDLVLKEPVSAAMVKENVEAALKRQAVTDASTIHIETSGGTVTLTGHAASFHTIHDATKAAWAAPGVTEVVDHLTMTL